MCIDKEKVIATTLTNIVEDAAKHLWGKLKNYFKDLDAKEDIEYGIAFEQYIKNTLEKYSKVKTLLYRYTPKDIYSFYECVELEFKDDIIDTSHVNEIIDLGHKIIITGTGGIGKTMMLKHLFINAINENVLTPVLIELRSFNSIDIRDINIIESIYETLEVNGFKLEKKYFYSSMEKGGYLILLDGYDEIKHEHIEMMSNEIKKVCDKYPLNNYILSSRPNEDFIGWNDFIEARAIPLNKMQAMSLIKKLEFDDNVKNVFLQELDLNLYERYESFASNPLLLTIMLLTFDNNATIPNKLNDFYDQAFTTLFNRHDATKSAFKRDIKSRLSCEDFKLIFAYFCFKSYFKSLYEFSETTLINYINNCRDKFKEININTDDFIYDLVQSVCMMVKEGLNFRFAHRSFQEYFAAWYTCKLTDDIQFKLVSMSIQETVIPFISNYYIEMLYNMQSDKFTKIVFCPELKNLKNLYNKYGWSLEIINTLFKEFRIVFDRISKKYSLFVVHKNDYISKIFLLTTKYKKFHYNLYKDNIDVSNNQNKIKTLFWEKLASRNQLKLRDIEIDNNFRGGRELWVKINMETAKQYENDILYCTYYIKKQVEFAIKIFEDYDSNNIKNKKTIDSIIDYL